MSKLYANLGDFPVITNKPISTEAIDLDKDLQILSVQVEGYQSVGRIYDSICTESLSFVDPKNHVLYTEYVGLLAKRMGVDAPKTVSMEQISAEGIQAANYSISLEGWMGDMWTKIKAVFTKIYESVKAFFARHFTRLGRIKKSLQNLSETIGSTSKDIGDPSLENPPEALLNAFKGHSEVNASTIQQSIDNIATLTATISTLNKAAEGFANEGLMPADFVSNIQALKDKALKASQDSDENRNKRKELSLLGDRDKKKALDSENKSLKQIASDSENKAEEDSNQIEVTANDLDSDDGKEASQKEYDEFMAAALKSFESVKGKVLINGTSVKNVSVNPEEGLVLEMDEGKDSPKTLMMSGKQSLASLVTSCQELLKNAENDVKKYGDINDKIMNSFKTIDRLTADIDKIDPERFGKYKKVINERIRNRLGLVRKFFTTYNKTCKNILEMSMDVSEHTARYAVLSLKHFK